jgi:hypothetical protein
MVVYLQKVRKHMNYIKQANDFLEKTNTIFEIEYVGHMKHFIDDMVKRDVYNVTLKRNGNEYTFRFGQCINDTGIEPDAYDVLACVQKYDVGTYKNFCDDFGYDFEDGYSENIYSMVVDEFKNIYLLFNDVMDELREIQ